MLPLETTKRKFIIIASLTFVSLVGYFIFLSIISSTNKALADLDYELGSEVRVESELKDLHDLVSSTAKEKEVLDSYFIQKDGVVDFINNLEDIVEKIGASSEIVLVDIKDDKVPAFGEFFEYLNVELKVDGTWVEVFNFSEILDNMPLYIKINKMTLENIPNKGEESGPSDIWRGLFNIDVVKSK